MPQATINPNSKPKKKKGRKPAHQNTFAFKHNPKSKLTAQILSSPNTGVCQRCHDKIEWRKKYRKYKPLTQASTCNLCSKRNVLAAYHTICCECSLSSRALEKVQSELMELSIEKKEENENTSEVLEEKIAKESIDDSHDDSVVGTMAETSNHFMKNAINHGQACAACVKDFALADDDQGTSKKEKAVNEQISEKEKELGRPLKLREQKAIERKVQKLIDQEKAKRREERRRANGFPKEDEEAVAAEEDEYSSGSDDPDQDDEISDDSESRDHRIDHVEDDEVEEDPFLLAVGGKDKLLTGEAYQRMLLEKERSTRIS